MNGCDLMPLRLVLSLSLLTGFCSSTYAQSYRRATTSAGIPVSWASYCIDLRLNKRGSERLAPAVLEQELLGSMNAWSSTECGGIELGLLGTSPLEEVGYVLEAENENLLVFRSGPGRWPHDPRVLALTTVTMCQNDSDLCAAGTILDADIEFNEEHFTFTGTDEPTQFDLANTMTHELGHLLGFDHSLKTASTMYASALPGQTYMRDLDEVDIEGLCAVYPTRPSGCDPPPEGTMLGDGGAAPIEAPVGCAAGTRGPITETFYYLLLAILFSLHRRRLQHGG
ncbi:MAG: matrixin family metalloprotease [Myxococcota bacterium]|nr:matrixin family metalloprotease [Myxococcota bacterium]